MNYISKNRGHNFHADFEAGKKRILIQILWHSGHAYKDLVNRNLLKSLDLGMVACTLNPRDRDLLSSMTVKNRISYR